MRASATELLVAVDAETDRVVGAVSLMTEDCPWAQIMQNTEAEFRLLAVEPSARQGGIGEALVRACVEGARTRGCTRLVLSTQPSMAAAQRLYERLGFRRTPERDWQTSAGGQRLVFSLQL
jgi:ribosomal protein S18 acetylase RimI-like enzyme